MEVQRYNEDAAEFADEVFEHFPYGILITNSDGQVLRANPAVAALIGTHPADEPATCCRLLGCRRPGSPLQQGCLSEFALAAGGALPEIRIDLAADAPGEAVWVTASPLRFGTNRVALLLRPGALDDRRRRTDPNWEAGPELRINVLGSTRVESRNGQLGGDWLNQRPGQLLKYLVCERGRQVPSDEIATAIWPGEDLRALNKVRHFVHALRDKIEPARKPRAPCSFVVAHRGGYSLNSARVQIDADLFEQYVRTGAAAFVNHEPAIAQRSLELAIELYRGDFIADEPYAIWALGERNRLRLLFGQANRMLAELSLREEDLEAAAQHLDRLATIEPLDLDVQRAALLLCLKRGRRTEAVRRYELLRMRLRHELDEEPAFDLAELTRTADEPLRLV